MENATAVIISHTSNLIQRGLEVLDEAENEGVINAFFETLMQAKGLLEMLTDQPHFQRICEPFNASIQFGLGVVLECMKSRDIYFQIYSSPNILMHDDLNHFNIQSLSNDQMPSMNNGYNDEERGYFMHQKEDAEDSIRKAKERGFQDNFGSSFIPDQNKTSHADIQRESYASEEFHKEHYDQQHQDHKQSQSAVHFDQDNSSFHDIIGQNDAKTSLFENVVLPLQLPDILLKSIFVGVRQASLNVLLFGPPGTGKTTLAKAASSEAGATFYSVTPSHILSKYQGESEMKLKELFVTAKKTSPAIIFFDEIDCVGTCRGTSADVQARRLLAELLLQMNEISAKDKIALIGATNRLEDMDPALLRRFYSRVFVGVPTFEDRRKLILSLMKGIRHELTNKDIETVSIQTDGWSGSDIETLCREAAMAPLRGLFSNLKLPSAALIQTHLQQIRPVCMNDFGAAYEVLMKPTLLNGQREQQDANITDEHHEIIG